MKHFCKTVGLASISEDTFYRVQKWYAAPVVDTYWTKMQMSILGSIGRDDVILAGDGRSDSPGHSAQYCSSVLTGKQEKGAACWNGSMWRRQQGRDWRNLGLNGAWTSCSEYGEISCHRWTPSNFTKKPRTWDIYTVFEIWHGAKRIGIPVNLGGDGRSDSPGQSAKYGSYTFLGSNLESVPSDGVSVVK